MMYKDLKKVYVRKLDDIINPTDNMLYITEDTGKAYIWDGIKGKLQELSGSDEIKETDPVWNAEKENYYKKDETYSKVEIEDQQSKQDTEIGKKANTVDIYTKTQVDSKLNDKADKSALNAKANSADVYNKTEIDTKLEDKVSEEDFEDHLALYRGLEATVNNNIYKKDETMSKTEIEASQKIQDDRIKILEDKILTKTK